MGFRMTLQTVSVLRVLLDDPLGEHYGLEIAKAAELPSGSLYPILARLERERWVTSDWEQIDERAAAAVAGGTTALRQTGLSGRSKRCEPPSNG